MHTIFFVRTTFWHPHLGIAVRLLHLHLLPILSLISRSKRSGGGGH